MDLNLLIYSRFSEKKLKPYIKINDIIKVDKIIFKIFFKSVFSITRYLFLLNKIKYTKTPNHVDAEVEIGIIMKPISLKKLKLIVIFKNTIKSDK